MKEHHQNKLAGLDLLAATLGVIAFVMLILRYGFPQIAIPKLVIFIWSAVLPIGLFLEAMYRLLWVEDPWRYLSLHPMRYVILLMIVLELSGVAAWSSGHTLSRPSASFFAGEFYLALFLLGFAGSWAKGAIVANRWLANRRLPVLALPALTFGAAIIAGAALLSLPGFHQRPISLLDNLFTSTSALCVTGLTVYDIPQTLNPIGHMVLALLIQTGGLGTMTILGMMALWHGGTLTLGERVAFSELVGGVRLAETRRLLATVIKVTLIVEFFGALAFWLLWRGRVDHSILQGAFHAISAFCNAGFALFSDSFASFRTDPPTLVVAMLLIIAGGAGFPVMANLAKVGISRIIPWLENRPLHSASRIVLLWTGGLIALGTALFLVDGWHAGTNRTFLEALFQAVTTRTAGFQIESQLRFNLVGLASTIMLMIVGASPQSTGGGVKTTIFVRLFKRVDPRDDVQSSKLLIAFKPFRLALILTGIYVMTATIAALVMVSTDSLSIQDAFFETFSALGTVGLSREVTPKLSPAGKWIDIMLMFSGRVLYPTLVMWMIRGRKQSADPVPWA